MENIISKVQKYFYENKACKLIQGNSLEVLKNIKPESIDMIFADPPYFLSNDGITCSGGKMLVVNKGKWDRLGTSSTKLSEKHEFNRVWIGLCRSLLKKDASIWISGTMHNIYSVGMALEENGFKIINNIIWQKTNPPPNLACRCFTHSTETILWAQKMIKNPIIFLIMN